jgi:hypothetical protein
MTVARSSLRVEALLRAATRDRSGPPSNPSAAGGTARGAAGKHESRARTLLPLRADLLVLTRVLPGPP